ncbi:MAG: cadherin-like domain-containing protein, partial [Leadbetterella sp.]|nr:cadherin-like domain-containing protein [Leadbetterella sp.]
THGIANYVPASNTSTLSIGPKISSDPNINGTPDTFDDGFPSGAPAYDVATNTYTLSNIPVINSISPATPATLQGWVDWNLDGKFQANEYANVTVPNGGTTATLSWTGIPPICGNTTPLTSYLRLRISTASKIDTASTTGIDERSIGVLGDGEVEDYAVSFTNIQACPIANPNTDTYVYNTAKPVDVLTDDVAAAGKDLTSVSIVGGTSPDAQGDNLTKVVAGEGTWTVDPVTGVITFTPEAGYRGDPTPIQYTFRDLEGNVSNVATVTLTFECTITTNPAAAAYLGGPTNVAGCSVSPFIPNPQVPTVGCDVKYVNYLSPVPNKGVYYQYWNTCVGSTTPTINANNQGFINQTFCKFDAEGYPAAPPAYGTPAVGSAPQLIDTDGLAGAQLAISTLFPSCPSGSPNQTWTNTELLQQDFWLVLPANVDSFNVYTNRIMWDAGSLFIGKNYENMCELSYAYSTQAIDNTTPIPYDNAPSSLAVSSYKVPADAVRQNGHVVLRVRLYVSDLGAAWRVEPQIDYGTGRISMNNAVYYPAISPTDNVAPTINFQTNLGFVDLNNKVFNAKASYVGDLSDPNVIDRPTIIGTPQTILSPLVYNDTISGCAPVANYFFNLDANLNSNSDTLAHFWTTSLGTVQNNNTISSRVRIPGTSLVNPGTYTINLTAKGPSVKVGNLTSDTAFKCIKNITLILVVKPCEAPKPDVNQTYVNVPVTGDVSTNDENIPSGSTYGTPAANASNPGTALPTVNPDGTYTFTTTTPGVYTFQVPVTLPDGSIKLVELVITVLDPTSTTNKPVANVDLSTTPLNTATTLATLSNDQSGNPGVALVPGSVTVTDAPASGTTSVNATTGAITYTPNTGFVGTDTLTYSVTDANGNVSTAKQIITVLPAGAANTTTSSDDYATTPANTAVTGNAITNDKDPNGDAQTVVPQTTTIAGKGTLTLLADGSYTFTPVAGFSGPVEFPYTTADNNASPDSSNATIHIIVQPVVPAPKPDVNQTYVNVPVTGDVSTNDENIPSGSTYGTPAANASNP